MKLLLRVYSSGNFLLAGVIVGLGFVAATAKFGATLPSLAELLEVGRNQFFALHRIEWLAVPIVVLLGFALGGRVRIASIVIGAIFAVQMAAIMPQLDDRMVRAIAGETLPASNIHFAYVGIALLQVIAHCVSGALALKQSDSLLPPQT